MIFKGLMDEPQISGLLAEADEAEKAGGCVQITPAFLRHMISELTVAADALNFYADEASWQSDHAERGPYRDIDNDNGRMARKALYDIENDRR